MSIKRIQYLGHSATMIDCGSLMVAIDPWLAGNPLCPEKNQNPEKLDLIVLTHGHADHAGDTPRLAKKCGSHVVATWELAMIMIAQGIPESKVIPMNKGGTVKFQNLSITLTQALHSNSFDTPQGPLYAGEPCGVLLSDGTHTVYHAGDTALFSDLKLIGERYHPQVALLPIGDRFTMGPQEAAKAAAWLGCKTAIPIHYKTFDLLTGTSEEFRAACKGSEVEVVALEPGEFYSL